MAYNNDHRKVETFLVTKGNQALVNDLSAGDTLPGGGVVPAGGEIPLMNQTNIGNVNLNPGQLGIFSAATNSFVDMNYATASTTTYSQVPKIQIVQGTDQSQNMTASISLVASRPFESSGIIYGGYGNILSGKVAKWDTFNLHQIGNPTTAANGQINVDSMLEYEVAIAYKGYGGTPHYSTRRLESVTYNYLTPDYTTLNLTSDLDHLVQNLTREINKGSKGVHYNLRGNNSSVAFAIGLISNGATDINNASFDNGGFIAVDTYLNNSVVFYANAQQIATLRQSMPANYGIIQVDVSTAGSSNGAEFIWIMALDRTLAYNDRAPFVKVGLNVGARNGFNWNVNVEELSSGSEGEGKSRFWQIFYENTHGQRKQSQFQRDDFPFIDVGAGIEPNTFYNIIILEHGLDAQIDHLNTISERKKCIILIPACDTTTTTSLLSYLNTWIKSTPRNQIQGETNAGGDLVMSAPDFC